ncbi:MAG TPA: glycosyltransferase [Actinomycetota bacterium]|nr:glycosyltransferase [Actinomycetota bacterium]
MREARAVVDKDLPPISVVIPAYNYADYLAPCVESVLAQTHAPADVVVVDDASTDATPEVVRAFGDRVTYVRHAQNSGLSAARNTGIRHAGADWITFLDADDVMKPGNLEAKGRRIAEHPSARILFGNAEVIDSAGNPLGVARPRDGARLLPQRELLAMLLERNPFFASSAVVARECFEVAGGFDEELRHAEDWDMWLRIAATFDGFYEDEPLLQHRTHAASMMKRNLKADVDLDAMRTIVANADRRGDLAAAGTSFDAVYWANYFRMLHNKVGRVPATHVLALYLRGLRAYPRRLVRRADVALLGKLATATLLPHRTWEKTRRWWRRRRGVLQ